MVPCQLFICYPLAVMLLQPKLTDADRKTKLEMQIKDFITMKNIISHIKTLNTKPTNS